MKNFKTKNLLILFISLTAALAIISCKKSGGSAPSEIPFPGYSSIEINPTAIIVPKSTTFKITVNGFVANDSAEVQDVTTQAKCMTSNPIATINSSGNLTNSYSGTSLQKLNLTCTLNGLSKTVPVTIVPATLISLILTKNNLDMGPYQSQSIKVYGNFKDNLNWIFALEMTNFVTWSTSDASVTNVLLGTVSSGSVGTANITASFGAINVSTSVTVNSATSAPMAQHKGVGLLGTYYDFGVEDPSSVPWTSKIGDPFERLFGQRIDSQVYFDWSSGVNNLGQPYYFGIRWTGKIYAPTTGTYTFYTRSDDGVRLWLGDVNGTPIINNWTLHSAKEDIATVNLVAGQFYDIKMEYFENAGYSLATLSWAGPSIAKQLIPQIYLFPE